MQDRTEALICRNRELLAWAAMVRNELLNRCDPFGEAPRRPRRGVPPPASPADATTEDAVDRRVEAQACPPHRPPDGLPRPASTEADAQTPRRVVVIATDVRFAVLTPQERRVANLVIAGHPNKRIAVILGVSRRTIEHHRQAAMRKLGAKSLCQLVRLALTQDGADSEET